MTTLTFVDYFAHNLLHKPPNELILFLLQTILIGLSFESKNIIFEALS